jgi:hypothetical protein
MHKLMGDFLCEIFCSDTFHLNECSLSRPAFLAAFWEWRLRLMEQYSKRRIRIGRKVFSPLNTL